MRCRYCGAQHSLVTEFYQDEDGFVSEDPIDLCYDCVEHHENRRRAREEYAHFHPGEPVPEVELPQPGPHS